jgi:hypothetical protein
MAAGIASDRTAESSLTVDWPRVIAWRRIDYCSITTILFTILSGEIAMQDDFSKYQAMKASGASPQLVYLQAANDGIDTITMFRLLRTLFSLDLGEAKEIIVKGHGWAESLPEYQDKVAKIITDGLSDSDK